MSLLLAQGEDPEAYDYAKVSAVHASVVNARPDIFELLRKYGANIECRDRNV